MVHDRATGMIEGVLVWSGCDRFRRRSTWLPAASAALVASFYAQSVAPRARPRGPCRTSMSANDLRRRESDHSPLERSEDSTIGRRGSLERRKKRRTHRLLASRSASMQRKATRQQQRLKLAGECKELLPRPGARARQAAADAKLHATATIWTTLTALALSLRRST